MGVRTTRIQRFYEDDDCVGWAWQKEDPTFGTVIYQVRAEVNPEETAALVVILQYDAASMDLNVGATQILEPEGANLSYEDVLSEVQAYLGVEGNGEKV